MEEFLTPSVRRRLRLNGTGDDSWSKSITSMTTNGVELHVQVRIPAAYVQKYTPKEWSNANAKWKKAFEKRKEKTAAEVGEEGPVHVRKKRKLTCTRSTPSRSSEEQLDDPERPRGRNREPARVKGFHLRGGPVFHPKFAWSNVDNPFAPDFGSATRGAFKANFVAESNWLRKIKATGDRPQRIVVIDPGQINFLTCMVYDYTDEDSRRGGQLRQATQDPNHPLSKLNTVGWGNRDVFDLENRVKASAMHIVTVTTREFYHSTLSTAHRSRKDIQRWIYATKKDVRRKLRVSRAAAGGTNPDSVEVAAAAERVANNKAVPYGYKPDSVEAAQQRRSDMGRLLMMGSIHQYREGLKAFLETAPELQSHWHRMILGHKAWERKRKRQQFFDALVVKLAPNPSDIFLVGSGFMGRNPRRGDYKKTRGRPPIIECLSEFARQRRVIMIPEWYTSKTHSVCGEEMVHKWQWRSSSAYSETGPPSATSKDRKQQRQLSVRKLHMHIEERKESKDDAMRGDLNRRRNRVRKSHAIFALGSGDQHTGPSGSVEGSVAGIPISNIGYSVARDYLNSCRSSEAVGSTRQVCLEFLKRRSGEDHNGSTPIKWIQIQTCRPQNGTSWCKACKKKAIPWGDEDTEMDLAVHRDANACCNILKAFLYQCFTGRRPFHLLSLNDQNTIRKEFESGQPEEDLEERDTAELQDEQIQGDIYSQ